MDDICIGLRTHILYPYYSTICGLWVQIFLHKAKGKREKSTSLILSTKYNRTVWCYKKNFAKKKSYVWFLRKMIYWHFRLYLCCVRLLNTNGIATYVWNLIKTNICGLKNFKYIYCGIKEA